MKWRSRFLWILLAIAALSAIVLIEIWVSSRKTEQVTTIINELEQIQREGLNSEKSKHEIVELRIKNEAQLYFWNNLIGLLAPTLTVIMALLTALIGLSRYLDERKKERLERAAVDLKNILELTVSSDPRVRTIGIVGLQHFFTPDKEEYHLRALSSLVATARSEDDKSEDDKEVIRSIRIAAEQAISILPASVLSQVSWQGVKLKNVNFSCCDKLAHLDFRDAILEDADMSHCNLQHVDFSAARLMGVNFKHADLQGANLTYADLAGADLSHANLKNATLNEVMVWDMNLDNTNLGEAKFDAQAIDWALTRNWRKAKFPTSIRQALIEKHGPDPAGLKVLMLMWEIPPLVAGGTWTACYHWIRKLRLLGVDITIAVPWDNSLILSNPFGSDVEVVSLGIKPRFGATSPYDKASSSPYMSSYGSASQWSSVYSPYGSASHIYGSYSSYSDSQRFDRGTSVLRIADMYARRLERFLTERDFNIIHAHDWVTFGAAEKAAGHKNIAWVAHFHSTERDRRVNVLDAVVKNIEKQGAEKATHIVTPSQITASMVQQEYGIKAEKISVIPNVLSSEFNEIHEVGAFETGRIVYLGRLTRQKAPDRFADLAQRYRQMHSSNHFIIWGDGEEKRNLQYNYNVHLMGNLKWSQRSRAFDGASVVYVPSRAEPFGMVVLEAMQHRVPVLYPKNAGVAEMIKTELCVNPEDVTGVTRTLEKLLNDWQYWEEIVEIQQVELEKFTRRQDERTMLGLWKQLTPNMDNQV
jgi:glycosyltransferase involved in cell wall biosynthesis